MQADGGQCKSYLKIEVCLYKAKMSRLTILLKITQRTRVQNVFFYTMSTYFMIIKKTENGRL